MGSEVEEGVVSHLAANFAFSVFIPTYNRAHLLNQAFKSLERQSFGDFEVIIIDDGSTDETAQLIQGWKESVSFPVKYCFQQNQGKIAAHNTAIKLARGQLFVSLDSDDTLLLDTLERIWAHWLSIPDAEREQYSGVEGHTAFADGEVCGSLFPKDRLVSNFLEVHYKLGVWGDKKGAIRSDLLRQYPYPRFPGEKHIRDSILWEDLAENYKCLYVNEVFQEIEQHADGLTANIFKVRMLNPQGFRHYYLRDIMRITPYFSLKHHLDSYHRYIRFSLHCNIGLFNQLKVAPSKLKWLSMLPKGYLKWLSDLLRMRRMNIKRNNPSNITKEMV